MTPKKPKEQLLAILRKCALEGDTEKAHGIADDALIEFIGDEEIEAAYEAVDKWYA